jgi:hypothetical protein
MHLSLPPSTVQLFSRGSSLTSILKRWSTAYWRIRLWTYSGHYFDNYSQMVP